MKSKRLTIPSVGKDVAGLDLSYTVTRNAKWSDRFGKQFDSLSRKLMTQLVPRYVPRRNESIDPHEDL